MEKYIDTLIDLMKSVILDVDPRPLDKDIDIEVLYTYAKRHAVENIVYLALIKLDNVDLPVLAIFKDKYNQAMLNDATQLYYLDIIINAFEENEIRYCVMKGPVIKRLYPSTDLRQSADLDIFVHDEDTEAAKNIMENLGFQTISFSRRQANDCYRIDKIVEIEIHRSLISRKCPWQQGCQEIVQRLVLSQETKYGYEMTIEDYYLYMIAHMAKHMSKKGSGIRMVLDIWIYLRHYNECMDWELTNSNLSACGLSEFEENVKKLCRYWFDNAETESKIKRMAMHIMDCGNFGLPTNELDKQAVTKKRKDIKAAAYLREAFPPIEHMKKKYPVLNKHIILLPFLWITRCVQGVMKNPGKIKKISDRYDRINAQHGEKLIELEKEIGL